MRPGGLLFLDTGLTTGWAYGFAGEEPTTGVWRLPAAQGLGPAGMAFENELTGFFEKYRPAAVGYEAPLIAGRQNNAHTAEVLIGLVMLIEVNAARWDIKVTRRTADTMRSRVCGRARITDEERRAKHTVKTAIVAPWIASMGWSIPEHNAADATVGWAYETGIRHDAKPKRRAA